jgi:hypothetical protein
MWVLLEVIGIGLIIAFVIECVRVIVIAETLSIAFKTAQRRWLPICKISCAEAIAGAVTVGIVGSVTLFVINGSYEALKVVSAERIAAAAGIIALTGIAALASSGAPIRPLKLDDPLRNSLRAPNTTQSAEHVVNSIRPWWRAWRSDADAVILRLNKVWRVERFRKAVDNVAGMTEEDWRVVLMETVIVANGLAQPTALSDQRLREALSNLGVLCVSEFIAVESQIVEAAPDGLGRWEWARQAVLRFMVLEVDGPLRNHVGYHDKCSDLIGKKELVLEPEA